jgi:hypothetical protein
MAKLTSWTCDVCGVQKHEMNHWFVYHVGKTFELGCWDEAEELWGHLCGEQCVLKKVAEVMGSLGK